MLAHRGLRSSGPENSLAGFQGVADIAARGILIGVELDARRTADDVLVTAHDSEIYFGPDKHRMVYCDDFYPNLQYFLSNNCPPKLDETLRILKDVPLINIDIKERGYTQAVVDACADLDPTRLNFSSHIPEVVRELRKYVSPESRIGMSVSRFWRTGENELLHLVNDTTADFLFAHFSLVTKSLRKRLHEQGKELGTYTVNDQDKLQEIIEIGVDYLCTDKPEMVIPTFQP